jgi:acylphosphatase
VWFRAACAERAREAGVAGWVRNLADGRVEAVFEGPGEDVAALVEWCRTGPPLARVTAVETFDEEPRGERGFALRRSS